MLQARVSGDAYSLHVSSYNSRHSLDVFCLLYCNFSPPLAHSTALKYCKSTNFGVLLYLAKFGELRVFANICHRQHIRRSYTT